MKKLQSLRRRNVVFGGAVVVLLAILLLRPTETSVVRQADLPLLFPKFHEQVAAVRRVLIEQGETAAPDPAKPAPAVAPAAKGVDLVRRDENSWVLASAFDHPVREGAIQRLLDGIAAARRKDVVTSQADTFARYADASGWIRIAAKDATGQTLVTLAVGKNATWPEVYALLEEGGVKRVAKVVGLERDAASLTTDDWIDPLLWPGLRADDIGRVDVEQRKDQRTLSFVKQAPAASPEGGSSPAAEATWKLVSPKEGEAIKTDVENLIRSFAGMRVSDVVAGAASVESDKTYGFDEPELVIRATGSKPEKPGAEPPAYVLTVGKKSEDGKSWYVRREGQTFTYTVPDYTADPFRKDPDSFLVKKEEPEPAEPPKDGAPADGDSKDGAPKDEAPADGEPKDGAPKDEAPKDGAAPGDAAQGDPDGK